MAKETRTDPLYCPRVYFNLKRERRGSNSVGRKGEMKELTKKLRSRDGKDGTEERIK
jgi:hypothetical protein